MSSTNDLIKQLRQRSKSRKKGSKTATKAFVKEAKPLTAELCGIEIKCPKCNSTDYVKNGHGRFVCKECGKSFSAVANTLLSGYDLTQDEWIKVLECVLNGDPNSRYSGPTQYSMSSKKAWFLRLKILSAFARMPQPILSGIIQVDGTYFRESQKGSRALKSFVHEKGTRYPRYKFEPSLAGIKGQEFICCLSGIDNSGHVFAKCVGYGLPDYDDFAKTLDHHIQTPFIVCSDNHEYYEAYFKEKKYQHYVEPSTFKSEKLVNGYQVVSDKYHPAPLSEKEIKNNEKILESMFYDKSGPHILNVNNMSYSSFKEMLSGYDPYYFGLERINNFHGYLKSTLVNNSKCVSSQYIQGYVSMLAYIRNFKVDNGHVLGSKIDDYQKVFKDVIEYFDTDYFKNVFMKDKRNIKIKGRSNSEKEKSIKKGVSAYSIKKTAFDESNAQEAPDIFNKRQAFRDMKPRRINYLCSIFNIDQNMPKTKKCDMLAQLPNADEIIFNEIKLLYFSTEEEVLDAINSGYLENPNKKRVGRPKGIKKTLNLTDEEKERLINMKKIVFDVETTGLDKNNDEILSLSILNGNGEELFNAFFKPERRRKWSRAERVNNITYEMLKYERNFDWYKERIQEIFDSAELLIGYNNPFDIGFLEANGIHIGDKEQFDVMLKFEEILKDGKKHKLTYCTDWYRYNWNNAQHSSLGDVEATLYCFNRMIGL